MTDQPSDSTLPESHVTRAGITGKVPKEWKPRRHGKRAKGRKLSGDKRHHAKSLQKRGMISSKAAAANGLPAK